MMEADLNSEETAMNSADPELVTVQPQAQRSTCMLHFYSLACTPHANKLVHRHSAPSSHHFAFIKDMAHALHDRLQSHKASKHGAWRSHTE